ncbi:metallophosphoesterase domain-containing protein [Plectosphaerella cucumerina]|uniref:Metallophosphoesterase domain-containing protein n=1 Tax=Plectosphaerella cucumerina TaxID=40658 RepID=A0A8K0T8P0_9PEZI|nr:metallophosphoesterase domain-containing protein [Plectosphaerella cucumerina]
MPTTSVRTRILIISDTHGRKPLEGDDQYDASGNRVQTYSFPLPAADVAIHCGDLTARSTTAEYESTFSMLRELSAPLKLVIPGNHDRTLDPVHWSRFVQWKEQIGTKGPALDELRARADHVRAIVDAAAADNVIFLGEGSHEFTLANGAKLRTYASPLTPEYGLWGFQYPPGSHRFDIPEGVDVAFTHGPPKDVLDATVNQETAGCPQLFDAICRARPKIHCFGHIHEAWGAKLVDWAPAAPGNRIAAEAFEKTQWIDGYGLVDNPEERAQALREAKCRPVDLTPGGDLSFTAGQQTLFVNAAIMDVAYRPRNAPWLVDIDLPRAGNHDDGITHL